MSDLLPSECHSEAAIVQALTLAFIDFDFDNHDFINSLSTTLLI